MFVVHLIGTDPDVPVLRPWSPRQLLLVAFRMPFAVPPLSETLASDVSLQSSDLIVIVIWLGVVPLSVSGTLNLTFPITSLHVTLWLLTSMGGGAAAFATGEAARPSPAASAIVPAIAKNLFRTFT